MKLVILSVIVLGGVYCVGMLLWWLARDEETTEGHDDAPCDVPRNGHVDGLAWWPAEEEVRDAP
jgi:hypothetical protein